MRPDNDEHGEPEKTRDREKLVRVKSGDAEVEISLTEIEELAAKIRKANEDGLSAIRDAFRNHPDVEHDVTVEEDPSSLPG